jgi:hypothetical protein
MILMNIDILSRNCVLMVVKMSHLVELKHVFQILYT